MDLASVYIQKDRIEEGVAELHKALKAEPEYPGALSTLAFYAINKGDEAGAREWMRHIKQQPRVDQELRDVLAKAYKDQFGRWPE